VEIKKKVSRTIQNEDTSCKIIIFSGKVKNNVTNFKIVEQVISSADQGISPHCMEPESA
jgi:hypothetical protein